MRAFLKTLFGGQDCRSSPLPAYALIYFEHLEGKYYSLPAASVPDESRRKLNEIAAKIPKELSWDDLFAFDLVLSRLIPKAELPRKVWSLRNRYRDVAGLREYDAYLASRPPDYLAQITDNKRQSDQSPPWAAGDKPALTIAVNNTGDAADGNTVPPKESDAKLPAMNSGTEAALRADVEFLLTQIHLRYAIRPAWDQQREHVSRSIATMTALGVGVLLIYVLLVSFTNWPIYVTTLGVVLFTGLLGGLLSVQQRYQSASDEGDPVHNITVLQWGNFSVLISPFSGALFAAIFYVVFVAGLVKGDLFPDFSHLSSQKPGSRYFSEFFTYATPNSIVAYAKLIVWSFIAGFFERLVPDTLSRFVAKQNMAGKGNV
ncbi:MAG: hypothetical protein V4634_13840 [Pseudomonadota bacterium]